MRYGWVAGLFMLAAGSVSVATEMPVAEEKTNLIAETTLQVVTNEKTADDLRDPFWPAGYSPITKTVAEDDSSITEETTDSVAEDVLRQALSLIRIEGIVKRGEKYYATVNGAMVEVGDTIPIIMKENTIVFIVRSIDMNGIKIRPMKK